MERETGRDRGAEGAERYTPIADYGLIGECHTAALVSRGGSIDWCCLPRLDSGSYFGRLVDWEKGGFCSVHPAGEGWTSTRRYVDGTLVLETTFTDADGNEARLTDCFAMREGGRHAPYHQILRVVDGVRGRMRLETRIAPRYDYGSLKPWIRAFDGLFTAIGGDEGLVIEGDMELKMVDRHELRGTFEIDAGERRRQ